MTDQPTDDAPAAAPAPEPAAASTEATAPNGTPLVQNKAFWAGVGIGSAALVAALMYAKRPKKKK